MDRFGRLPIGLFELSVLFWCVLWNSYRRGWLFTGDYLSLSDNMVDQELSFDVEGVWIERRIGVQLDSMGEQFLEYNARTKITAKDEEGVIKLEIPSSIRPLWDLLYIRDGYVLCIIGVDCQDQIRVRKYGDTVADGLDTDGLLWTVFFKDTPATDPPIQLELMQYE